MALTDPQKKLMSLLECVFEDTVVDKEERKALRTATTSGELTDAQAHTVFERFMEKTWGEAMEDGRLTPQEQLLLLGIMKELDLEETAIPPQMRMALLID
ncbi:MAG: hypothetical protein AAGH15_22820 [Myxococcota bacterium]